MMRRFDWVLWWQVWISVTAFLHFVAQQQPSGGEAEPGTKRAEELGATAMAFCSGAIPLNFTPAAMLFAPIFFRDTTSSYPPISPLKKREFLLLFIG